MVGTKINSTKKETTSGAIKIHQINKETMDGATKIIQINKAIMDGETRVTPITGGEAEKRLIQNLTKLFNID
jgi:hypothetical protein